MAATFLLRYGEIALKGQNQRYFLDRLVQNVERAVADLGPADVRQSFGRVLVRIEADEDAVRERLRKVFGIVSLSPVREAEPELEGITAAAVELAGGALSARPGVASFKVDTRRADKRFPLSSMETSSKVGEAIRLRFPQLQAKMRAPDLLVGIDIRERAYLSTESIAGPGGLPSGTGGKALALISGGIDSPVAAWLVARRGAVLAPVHFHSFPFTSERAKEKVVDLCRVLAEFTGPLQVGIVYFTEIQRAIQRHVPDALRVLVMRRMMMRLCDRLAPQVGARALVTGESLGQVASQTLESLSVINAATTLPVLRPLIGADKTEIVSRAEAIGTYAISIRPYEDCCSLFVPAHPRTLPTRAEVDLAEGRLDMEALINEALARTEHIEITRRDVVPSAVGFSA